MAVQTDEIPAPRVGEETPLLRDRTKIRNGDDRSSETLTDESLSERGELEEDWDNANQEVGRMRGISLVLSLWGLIFLQASNMSGITTTQGSIAHDLDAFSAATWFTSTYLIAMSSTSPLAARLAQIFSPRNCVLVAATFFAIGGLVASKALSLPIFLLGRSIQGIGGAGILTIAFILVLELAGKKNRGLFIGLVNTGFTTGVALGAVIAGALLPVTGWRFLFWIQTPLAMVFGLGAFLSIPKTFTSQGSGEGSIGAKLARIDYLGAITLTTSLSLFLFGLSWPKVIWTPIIISLFGIILFVLIEICIATEPIIPVTVLKSRGALLSCIAQLGVMAARWGVLFYSPAFALAVRGWSPASAGAILIPTNLGFASGGILAGALHIKRAGSFWLPSILTYFFFASTLAVLSQISTATSPTWLYILTVFTNGFCIGASLNYTLAHLLHLTPPSTHFISTSLLTTFRGFAGSFGSAIGGGLFVRVLKSQLEEGFEENGGLEGREDLVRRLLGSPALVQSLTGVEKQVAVGGYEGSLKQLFIAGAAIALVFVVVQAGTGVGIEGSEKDRLEGERDGESFLVEDEEWEEGMEQGV